jgi:hypothetical protein
MYAICRLYGVSEDNCNRFHLSFMGQAAGFVSHYQEVNLMEHEEKLKESVAWKTRDVKNSRGAS